MLLGSSKKCKLITKTKPRFGEYGADFETTYELVGEPDKQEVAGIMQTLNATASPMLIADKLNDLSMITASKADDYDTHKQKIAIYTKRLIDYPADLLIETLESGFKFFPTLFEIEDKLRGKVAMRNMKFRKLMR
jgi:hypothetical protein